MTVGRGQVLRKNESPGQKREIGMSQATGATTSSGALRCEARDGRSPLGNEALDSARCQRHQRLCRVLLCARQADEGAGQLGRAHQCAVPGARPVPR